MEISNLQIDVSDGWGFFSGSLSDLSRFGLCMRDLPKKINQNAHRYSIVISGDGKNFKLLARPRWNEDEQRRKTIGVEIINAPWGWTEFVISKEPQSDDPWVAVHL